MFLKPFFLRPKIAKNNNLQKMTATQINLSERSENVAIPKKKVFILNLILMS